MVVYYMIIYDYISYSYITTWVSNKTHFLSGFRFMTNCLILWSWPRPKKSCLKFLEPSKSIKKYQKVPKCLLKITMSPATTPTAQLQPQWRGVPAQLLSRFEAITNLHLAIDLVSQHTAPTVGPDDFQPSWRTLGKWSENAHHPCLLVCGFSGVKLKTVKLGKIVLDRTMITGKVDTATISEWLTTLKLVLHGWMVEPGDPWNPMETAPGTMPQKYFKKTMDEKERCSFVPQVIYRIPDALKMHFHGERNYGYWASDQQENEKKSTVLDAR